MKIHVFRLLPGDDLKSALQQKLEELDVEAGVVLTCVGSLEKTKIRYANQMSSTGLDGKFEILSLAGTLSKHGSHLHICIADGTGKTMGGHLTEGCTVFTTAEIVIGVFDELRFFRKTDPQTGYKELDINEG